MVSQKHIPNFRMLRESICNIIFTFTSHTSPILFQCFSSLLKAVTSQTEKNELKEGIHCVYYRITAWKNVS